MIVSARSSSLTLALAAAGCVPFASCNGGGLGGRHEYVYPLVAFYLPPSAVALVVAAAAEADAGLFQDPRYGTVQVYGRRLIHLHQFACALSTRREHLLPRESSQTVVRARWLEAVVGNTSR